MKHDSPSPDEQNALSSSTVPAEPDSPAVATDLEDSFFETRRLRKDGWDGAKMASFCGTLAETGVVTFACRASGMSAQSAYGVRHRNPVFAKAWEAALSMARERLADELLARSLKGGAEQLLKDGCIVAERHTFDNKLAFAMLRRLDHRAELGTTFRTPAAWEIPAPAPAVKGQWQDLLDALSEERSDDAMALLDPPKVDSEVDDPLFEGVDSDSLDDEPYVPKRVWQEWKTEQWRTDFPPPPEFDGEEKGQWEDSNYSRTLSTAEFQALAADGPAEPPEELITLAQDEADRDAYFAALANPPPSAGADTSPRKAGGGAEPPSPSPVSEADFKAPSAPLRGGNVGGGEVSARSDDGGGVEPQKPPESEPPVTPNRSKRGASKPGENP